MQINWKHKSIGNISQLETRPGIGWSSCSTIQRTGFQLTYVSNWLMLPIDLHMIRSQVKESEEGCFFLMRDRVLWLSFPPSIVGAKNCVAPLRFMWYCTVHTVLQKLFRIVQFREDTMKVSTADISNFFWNILTGKAWRNMELMHDEEKHQKIFTKFESLNSFLATFLIVFLK